MYRNYNQTVGRGHFVATDDTTMCLFFSLLGVNAHIPKHTLSHGACVERRQPQV